MIYDKVENMYLNERKDNYFVVTIIKVYYDDKCAQLQKSYNKIKFSADFLPSRRFDYTLVNEKFLIVTTEKNLRMFDIAKANSNTCILKYVFNWSL